MSLETEQGGQVLCSIHLSRKDGGRTFSAKIQNPAPSITQPPLAPEPVKDWGCTVTIDADGIQQIRTLYSVSWLSSFLLALKFVRTFIPDGEECEWVDEYGVESWCVLPRFVPIGWGYDLYHQISCMSEDAARSYEEDVQRRRLASEKKSVTEQE